MAEPRHRLSQCLIPSFLFFCTQRDITRATKHQPRIDFHRERERESEITRLAPIFQQLAYKSLFFLTYDLFAVEPLKRLSSPIPRLPWAGKLRFRSYLRNVFPTTTQSDNESHGRTGIGKFSREHDTQPARCYSSLAEKNRSENHPGNRHLGYEFSLPRFFCVR